jgi:large subunit ribosomal protein L23
MGLFNRKKNTEEVKAKDTKAVAKKTDSPVTKAKISAENINILGIVKCPRVSEKAAVVGESSNAYIFNVAKNATKTQIKAAIEKIYKVTPLKIAIAQVPDKKVQIRGKRGKTGVKSGGKKAFVFLKKGEKIEFI